MQHPNETIPRDTAEDVTPWHQEVGDLLAQAAILCISHGLDAETFMKGAWSAYIEARPGLREYIEDMRLRGQLEEIRKLGRMALA